MGSINWLNKFESDCLEKIQPDMHRFFAELSNDVIHDKRFPSHLSRNIRNEVEQTYDRYWYETKRSAVPNVNCIEISEVTSNGLAESTIKKSTNETVSSTEIQTSDDIQQDLRSNESNSMQKYSEDTIQICYKQNDSQKTEAVQTVGTNDEIEDSPSPPSIVNAPSNDTSVIAVKMKLKTKTRHSTGNSVGKRIMNTDFDYYSDGSDHKPQGSIKSTPKTMHQCKQCEFSSPTVGRLSQHMTKHSNTRPFKCEQCPRDFKLKPNLNRHINSNACKKLWTYTCDLCSFSISDPNHIRDEHEEFECSQCGRKCTGRTAFIDHLRVHFPRPDRPEYGTVDSNRTDDELVEKYRKFT